MLSRLIWEINMKKEILLKVNNVSVNFGSVIALENVSISIDEGEIVSLIGPNGAGKSTILKTIFGLTEIKSGDILWNNDKIIPIPYQMVRRGLSYVPQGKQIFPSLTVEENLELGGYVIGDKEIIKQRIEKMMDIFPKLRIKRNKKAEELSGGEQQICAIARGLMTEPKILFLDEPSLGLAPKIVKDVFLAIQEINEKYKTAILIVEHNIKSLLKIVDRSYILDKGKIVEENSIQDIDKQETLKKIFSGK
jgi:branched-chain amino acid transport system ATP-binding protein